MRVTELLEVVLVNWGVEGCLEGEGEEVVVWCAGGAAEEAFEGEGVALDYLWHDETYCWE